MEFYVLRVKYQTDGTTKLGTVMTYTTLREAEAKFYKNLGEDMSDTTLSGGVCKIFASDGKDILPAVKWGQKTIIEEEATE